MWQHSCPLWLAADSTEGPNPGCNVATDDQHKNHDSVSRRNPTHGTEKFYILLWIWKIKADLPSGEQGSKLGKPWPFREKKSKYSLTTWTSVALTQRKFGQNSIVQPSRKFCNQLHVIPALSTIVKWRRQGWCNSLGFSQRWPTNTSSSTSCFLQPQEMIIGSQLLLYIHTSSSETKPEMMNTRNAI